MINVPCKVKMKKVICLCLFLVLSLTGCSESQTSQTNTNQTNTNQATQKQADVSTATTVLNTNQSNQNENDKYKTLISSGNKLEIVRRPPAADYTFFNPGKLKALPKASEMGEFDLRSSDLTEIDLGNHLQDLLKCNFDTVTKWPDKLPSGFNPQSIMELGKNPGLNIRNLHKKGITGKNVGIAIIDQALLVDHIEYKDRLKSYEEIHSSAINAQMHGSAVSSISVGKSVGVAPEADLYYIAADRGTSDGNSFEYDVTWIAKSIDRIVEINKTLPKEKKIRVISISLGIGKEMNNYQEAFDAIQRATKEGICTIHVGSNSFAGAGRDPLKSADNISSYCVGEWIKSNMPYMDKKLLVPMDSRCTASPTGEKDYVFYRYGGESWVAPYVAGLYALSCQVNPDITPEIFWDQAFKTCDSIQVDSKGTKGKMVNPVKLIEVIQKLK